MSQGNSSNVAGGVNVIITMAEGALFYGAIANILLGAFNLIPAFPLDGGENIACCLGKTEKRL